MEVYPVFSVDSLESHVCLIICISSSECLSIYYEDRSEPPIHSQSLIGRSFYGIVAVILIVVLIILIVILAILIKVSCDCLQYTASYHDL